MLATGRPLVLPGCYNALTARILEHAGHEALYMTGYGVVAFDDLPEEWVSEPFLT